MPGMQDLADHNALTAASAQHTPGKLPLAGSLDGKDPADMSAIELQALVYALRSQRDELLTALQMMESDGLFIPPYAEAAIAKATGSA